MEGVDKLTLTSKGSDSRSGGSSRGPGSSSEPSGGSKSRTESKSSRAADSSTSELAKEAVKRGLLTEEQAARIGSEERLREAVDLVSNGAVFGLDEEKVKRIVYQYVSNPGAEDALDAALLGQAEVWQAVRTGGTDGGMIAIHRGVFGLPAEAYRSGKFGDVVDGQRAAAEMGADGATSDPNYWKDYARVRSGDLSTSDFVTRYSGKDGTDTASTGDRASATPEDASTPASPDAGQGNADDPAPTPSGTTPDQVDTTPQTDGPSQQLDDAPSNSGQPAPDPSTNAPPSEPSAPGSGATAAAPATDPSQTVVATDGYNIGGATWLVEIFADGHTEQKLIDNNTKQILQEGPSGDIQVNDEPEIVLAGDGSSSQAGSDDSSSSADSDESDDGADSTADSDSTDDDSDSSDDDSSDANDDSDSDDDSSDSDDDSSDSDDDSDSNDDRSDSDDDSQDDTGDDVDEEESDESTPGDPNEPTEEQKRALREAMLTNEVFQTGTSAAYSLVIF